MLGCFVVAAGWMAYAFGTKNEQIYNPGHVTGAHATIENNCAACHTPDPQRPGQFSKAVSDSACIDVPRGADARADAARPRGRQRRQPRWRWRR